MKTTSLPTNQTGAPAGDLCTKTEAAAFLRIKNRTLDDWRAAKIFPCIERGRYIRFRRSDLEAFLASHTVQSREAATYRPRTRQTTPPTTPSTTPEHPIQ
jgi:excisionase family DNA binding protein